MDKIMITIILPVLNEVDCVKKIDLLIPYINSYQYEIIVVDDSSDDKFISLEKDIKGRQKLNINLIKGDHQGKGAAIKKGVLESAGSIVFYIDADLRIELDNIPRFIELINKQGYDLVIAQRPFNKTPRSLLRLIFSAALFVLVRVGVFNSTFFYDTQCGFKCFKGNILRKFAARQTVNGGMFDVEYLYMARFNRLKICKVQVQPLAEIRESKINLWRSLFCDVFDLFSIKINGLRKYYKIEL